VLQSQLKPDRVSRCVTVRVAVRVAVRDRVCCSQSEDHFGSPGVLQCVAVRVALRVAMWVAVYDAACCSQSGGQFVSLVVLQYVLARVAVYCSACCSALPCVAARERTRSCVSVCFSVL